MSTNKITTMEEAETFYMKDHITKNILQKDSYYYRTAKFELDNLLEDTMALKKAIEATLIDNAEKMRKRNGHEAHIDKKVIEKAYLKLDRDYREFSRITIKEYESKRRKQMKEGKI